MRHTHLQPCKWFSPTPRAPRHRDRARVESCVDPHVCLYWEKQNRRRPSGPKVLPLPLMLTEGTEPLAPWCQNVAPSAHPSGFLQFATSAQLERSSTWQVPSWAACRYNPASHRSCAVASRRYLWVHHWLWYQASYPIRLRLCRQKA